ncbi:hypothetical protein [Verrucosispora sioxanthis]|uniref:hypothetical protein n=1 Tax=Verrucosispora sioxanthis TaxID=2499994 RepID=UPI002E2AE910|nr:hypothetical protein [Verrucosispora sioxanthis]
MVGRSGAGKSALAAVAGRLYDPDTGEVLLDGCHWPTSTGPRCVGRSVTPSTVRCWSVRRCTTRSASGCRNGRPGRPRPVRRPPPPCWRRRGPRRSTGSWPGCPTIPYPDRGRTAVRR